MDQKWVSFIFLFSAVGGVSAYVPHQYIFVNESKTWTEAQNYCRQNYTDLATVNNMEEMMKLNATLKDKARGLVWIGLNKGDTGIWRWSLANESFYREGDEYRNWRNGEPNNQGKQEYCVAMKKDKGNWIDDGCNDRHTFVCYDKNKKTSDRYIFIYENKSWREAQSYCRGNYTDLASVRNLTENEKIFDLARNSTSDIWIGLFNDSWKWSDQSNSLFRYWMSGQPDNVKNEKCAAVSMTDHGQWHDVDCQEKRQFVCQEKKLILINQNLTWSEALRYCRVNHVDLVSVHTEEIQLWVEEVALNASTEHVWLGLRHTCTLGFWFWVSGESICDQNWAPGNGTGGEDCSSVERTGAVQSGGEQQWVSLPETQRLNFICITYEG